MEWPYEKNGVVRCKNRNKTCFASVKIVQTKEKGCKAKTGSGMLEDNAFKSFATSLVPPCGYIGVLFKFGDPLFSLRMLRLEHYHTGFSPLRLHSCSTLWKFKIILRFFWVNALALTVVFVFCSACIYTHSHTSTKVHWDPVTVHMISPANSPVHTEFGVDGLGNNQKVDLVLQSYTSFPRSKCHWTKWDVLLTCIGLCCWYTKSLTEEHPVSNVDQD